MLLVNPVPIVVPNFTEDSRRFLANHGHTIVGLLPELISESSKKTIDNDTVENCDGKYGETIIPLTDNLYESAKRPGSEKKLVILHTAVERMLRPLSPVFEKRFTVSSRNRKEKFHLVVFLHCCDIPQSKGMSGVKHCQTFLPFIRGLSIWGDVFALKRGNCRLDTNMGKFYIEANQGQHQEKCPVQNGKRKKHEK